MKSLLLRAVPLALVLAAAQPAWGQSAAAAPQAAQPAELSPAQWREDLRFMVRELTGRHPDPYHHVSKAAFDAAVAELDGRIPSLQRNQIIVGMMRIAAMIGDGHTRVEPRKDPKFQFRSLPLKLYLFDDGLFVRAAQPDYAGLLGAEILEVGGVPLAEALRRVGEITSRENPMGPKMYAPIYLNMPDILQALGMSASPESATFRLRKGKRIWTASIPAGQVDPVWPPDTDISLVTPEGWVDARSTPKPPLWLQDVLDLHRLVELPERRAIYARLDMVANEEGQSLTDFGKAIGERARATNPKAIVLDLRLNTGGNGSLRNGFVRELIRAEDEDTELFVLTRRGTFSASQFILNDLDRLTGAIFLGEPAASKPSSHGDSYRNPMPNSGIAVRTSVKWWQDGQNFAPWTYVDEHVPLNFADYAAGRDPVLEAALSYVPRPKLHELAIQTATAAELRRVLDAYLADPRNRYANLDVALIATAEALAARKRTDEALDTARLATLRSPDNVVAHLTLGILAERAGRLDVAADAAARAMAVDPNEREARALLERVRDKQQKSA